MNELFYSYFFLLYISDSRPKKSAVFFFVHFRFKCPVTSEGHEKCVARKNHKRFFVQTTQNCPGTIREESTPLVKGDAAMQTQTNAESSKNQQIDEELADTLTAISVVSKRLAQKIKALSAKEQGIKKGGTLNEQNE